MQNKLLWILHGGAALLIAAFALFIPAAHAQIYKCVQGHSTVFSDKPCAEGSEVKLKSPVGNPESDIKFDVLTTHYPVSGRNYAEAFRRMVSQNPEGFSGWARWVVDYRFETLPRKEGCSIDRVHISITGQIMMPEWDTLAQASPIDQSYWRTMYAGLKRHEDGHIQNGREFALLLQERLLGLGTVPCDTIRARAGEAYRVLYANLQDRDSDYDRRTDHGRRQDNPR